MKGVLLVGVLLVLFYLPTLAGEYLMNDTGLTVYGLTVSFSEPVTLTGYGDVLLTVNPTGISATFTFLGGELEAWGGHWLNWDPVTTQLLSHEWITSEAELSAFGVGGIPVETSPTTESPTISGELLNPLYFAHGACVMQGVADLDKILAMPLLGVEELSFWPTAEGIDPGAVTWTIEQITEPEGISAEIRDDTLYIWGSDPSWAGYGDVILTAIASAPGRRSHHSRYCLPRGQDPGQR